MPRLEEFFHWISARGRFTNSVLSRQVEFASDGEFSSCWAFPIKCSGLFLAVVLETNFQNMSSRYVGVEIFPDLLFGDIWSIFGNICGVLSVENNLGSVTCESLLLRKRTVDDDFGVSNWAPLGWKVLRRDLWKGKKPVFSVASLF